MTAEQRDERQHRLDAAVRDQHPRGAAADQAEEIQDADGAPLGEAERHEPVRDVIGAALAGLPSGQPAQHQHEAGVEERNDQDERPRSPTG